mmetsp:Transcript_29105/g.78796  ORF Transcript_29105/g.78796 Transcript_29105/m.78796 type:complete len:341 (+) Transcript_29105:868-1890(+)
MSQPSRELGYPATKTTILLSAARNVVSGECAGQRGHLRHRTGRLGLALVRCEILWPTTPAGKQCQERRIEKQLERPGPGSNPGKARPPDRGPQWQVRRPTHEQNARPRRAQPVADQLQRPCPGKRRPKDDPKQHLQPHDLPVGSLAAGAKPSGSICRWLCPGPPAIGIGDLPNQQIPDRDVPRRKRRRRRGQKHRGMDDPLDGVVRKKEQGTPRVLAGRCRSERHSNVARFYRNGHYRQDGREGSSEGIPPQSSFGLPTAAVGCGRSVECVEGRIRREQFCQRQCRVHSRSQVPSGCLWRLVAGSIHSRCMDQWKAIGPAPDRHRSFVFGRRSGFRKGTL